MTMPAGGQGVRPRAKNENCAPKPHAARRVYLKDDMWRKAFSFFAHGLAGIVKVFRSTFLQKSLRCCGKPS
ncbi:hypothetical protein EDM56_09600 [Brevibacillus fluminis]|uniref:Uncharacterized protein n=1 Tax=Brevibacillus fluminis TaxID=511487 RepID=A0A3M8DPT4_9BACL|nr:hypothetical protein EDM56_09600 [Brevibacillus fluminis]